MPQLRAQAVRWVQVLIGKSLGRPGREVMVINIGVELGVYEKLKLFAKHNDIIIMSMNQQ